MTSAFTVDVVSPQFPCGAAWLANALLELQVPLAHLWGFDTSGEWLAGPDGTSRYAAAHAPWRQTLASLRTGRDFRFIQGVRPRFTHAFPWQIARAPKTVWMVRDPRDALHSEWHRQRRNEGLPPGVDFPDFLRQPFLGGPVSVADMLWLHLAAWQAVALAEPERVLLLRFEDWKRKPIDALDRVARWIGVPTDAAALRRACAASDVSHLQAIEQSLMLENPQTRQFNRRGSILEWEGTWRRDWYAAMGPEWSGLLDALGYAPLDALGQGGSPCDLQAMLAWRGLTDPQALDVWLRALAGINTERSAAQ